MANHEHLDILKQGVEVWNHWRNEHNDIDELDLSGADLNGASLTEADLNCANLSEANLSHAVLEGANLNAAYLEGANLSHANLSHANLEGAALSGATLSGAILIKADFTNATLSEANLTKTLLANAKLSANLSGADLSGADLLAADLSGAELLNADLSRTRVGVTIFGDVDLSVVKGLETVKHQLPSTIGIDTIIKSQGKIPEIFLRMAGVPPSIIEAIPALVGSLEPIQFYSCFISYSSKDQDFAERLYADLQSNAVRCWYAPYDLKIGDKWRDRIEESIRLHDKLLLVLSQHSIESPRVEEEAVSAQDKEERYFRETGVERLVLFPICLDEAVKKTSKTWAASLRRLRHIGNFTCWKDHDAYQKAFTRLLRDLKAEAQKTEAREGTANSG